MIRPLHVLDAAAFARERLGFNADSIQAQILEVGHTRGLLNCSRQWGKSTTMAVKAVHRAYVTPASQIMIVSHTQRQSNELMGKAEDIPLCSYLPRDGSTNPPPPPHTKRACGAARKGAEYPGIFGDDAAGGRGGSCG